MKNRNRTIIVDFADESQYQKIIVDGAAFLEFVVDYLLALGLQLLHQRQCSGGNCFTRHSHCVRTRCSGITIWRIQCKPLCGYLGESRWEKFVQFLHWTGGSRYANSNLGRP